MSELLGPPPLLTGEDPEKFERLLDAIRSAVEVVDAIEEILVHDIAAQTWEIFRFRRLKAAFMNNRLHLAVSDRLTGLVSDDSLDRLADGWIARDAAVMKEIEEAMGEGAEDAVDAENLVENIVVAEQLDRFVAVYEERRNAMLREIDRRRDALARRLRNVISDIEDAEFEEISRPARDVAE